MATRSRAVPRASACSPRRHRPRSNRKAHVVKLLVDAERAEEREIVGSQAALALMQSHVGHLLARSLQAGIQLGFFNALAGAPATADEVAASCKTNLRATTALIRP